MKTLNSITIAIALLSAAPALAFSDEDVRICGKAKQSVVAAMESAQDAIQRMMVERVAKNNSAYELGCIVTPGPTTVTQTADLRRGSGSWIYYACSLVTVHGGCRYR